MQYKRNVTFLVTYNKSVHTYISTSVEYFSQEYVYWVASLTVMEETQLVTYSLMI